MLESDRIAIKYSLADLDHEVPETEVAKRVTIGHEFSVFHRMHVKKLQSEFNNGGDIEITAERKGRKE